MSTKKIGIYSGVFDPVHHGHISFAQKAMHELGLDKVYFMVEPQPRRKADASDIRHRLNMMWLALREHPNLELLHDDEHQTFSLTETLPWLKEKFEDAKLYLLMGTDLFKTVHTWSGFDQFGKDVRLVVGQREGDDSSDIPIDHDRIEHGLCGIASSSVRQLPAEQLSTVVPEDVTKYINTEKLYQTDV